MSRFELDIGPRRVEKSFESKRALGPFGLNSHSVTVVATLTFPISCSHFEANTKI